MLRRPTYHRSVKILLRCMLCLSLLCLVPAGCKRGSDAAALKKNQQEFPVRGRVVSVDKQSQEIMLAHEAVPGFMEAMTMPYRTSVPEALGELHPGDTISARLLVEKDADGDYHNAALDRIVVVGQSKADYVPQKQYHIPKPGDVVPDFKLLNQSGQTKSLLSYRGKALLLTFIYTRCPLGDFCPRMSRNFAQIDADLAKDRAVYAKTDLLSISFDPVYDTPAVLRSYGGAYTGQYTNEKFTHWQFAAPAKDDLQKVEQYFNVGVTGQDATLTHSLSTVLIDPAGKIAAWYPGNGWKPEDVSKAMRDLVARS